MLSILFCVDLVTLLYVLYNRYNLMFYSYSFFTSKSTKACSLLIRVITIFITVSLEKQLVLSLAVLFYLSGWQRKMICAMKERNGRGGKSQLKFAVWNQSRKTAFSLFGGKWRSLTCSVFKVLLLCFRSQLNWKYKCGLRRFICVSQPIAQADSKVSEHT